MSSDIEPCYQFVENIQYPRKQHALFGCSHEATSVNNWIRCTLFLVLKFYLVIRGIQRLLRPSYFSMILFRSPSYKYIFYKAYSILSFCMTLLSFPVFCPSISSFHTSVFIFLFQVPSPPCPFVIIHSISQFLH